ncbi:putative sulfate exporter family transporter [Escherichia coli]
MTNITLQKQHRTLWHFIPGLALSAVITGVALWGGSIPRLRVPGLVPHPRNLVGHGFRNTIYPHIWKSCDGGVLFAKQYLLRLGIILYGFRLTSRKLPMSVSVGSSLTC